MGRKGIDRNAALLRFCSSKERKSCQSGGLRSIVSTDQRAGFRFRTWRNDRKQAHKGKEAMHKHALTRLGFITHDGVKVQLQAAMIGGRGAAI